MKLAPHLLLRTSVLASLLVVAGCTVDGGDRTAEEPELGAESSSMPSLDTLLAQHAALDRSIDPSRTYEHRSDGGLGPAKKVLDYAITRARNGGYVQGTLNRDVWTASNTYLGIKQHLLRRDQEQRRKDLANTQADAAVQKIRDRLHDEVGVRYISKELRSRVIASDWYSKYREYTPVVRVDVWEDHLARVRGLIPTGITGFAVEITTTPRPKPQQDSVELMRAKILATRYREVLPDDPAIVAVKPMVRNVSRDLGLKYEPLLVVELRDGDALARLAPSFPATFEDAKIELVNVGPPPTPVARNAQEKELIDAYAKLSRASDGTEIYYVKQTWNPDTKQYVPAKFLFTKPRRADDKSPIVIGLLQMECSRSCDDRTFDEAKWAYKAREGLTYGGTIPDTRPPLWEPPPSNWNQPR